MADPIPDEPGEERPAGADYVRRMIDNAPVIDGDLPPPAPSAAIEAGFDQGPAPAPYDVDPETGEMIAPAADPDLSPANSNAQGVVGSYQTALPPDCPVQALGRNKGVYSFSNSDGQLIELAAKSFNANTLMDLFDGNADFALTYWARHNKTGTVGFDAGGCRDDLMAACKRRGIFSAENRLRGRGAWRNADGALILHLGDEIWVEMRDEEDRRPFFVGEPQEPGLIEDFFYEADEALQRPWPEPVSPAEIRPLLDRLQSWNWVRGYTAPRLMLGWMAQGMIAGALTERSHIIVQGDSGAGKSTLQALVGYVYGPGKVQVSDATEAGLSSELRNQTLPVMFDEFEASEDNRKSIAVVGLMRRSTSGGKRVRGSSDHRAHSSTTQSPFFVSMITPPPLETQDLNRLALLQLRPLKKGGEPFKPKEADWAPFGQKLLRRMLDGWSQFEERQEIYAQKLSQMGHTGRGQDTIGNLLACADIALGDAPPDADTLSLWTEGLAPDEMLEYDGVSDDFEQCLTHILQSHPKRWQGSITATSIGQVIHDKLRPHPPEGEDLEWAQKALGLAGLAVVKPRGSIKWELLIPNNHSATRELFAGSKWGGSATSMGSWAYSLTLGPATSWRKGTGYVDGRKTRGILIDRDVLLPEHAYTRPRDPVGSPPQGGRAAAME